jgi:uncharacterized protein with HEPN domain
VRSDRERLLDILEAIERIERHAAAGRDAFERDELLQTWMVHHLQIIGEACRALSADFVRRHAHVPWPKVIGMRNILVHHYFGIDLDAVWAVIERDLPELKNEIEVLTAAQDDVQDD